MFDPNEYGTCLMMKLDPIGEIPVFVDTIRIGDVVVTYLTTNSRKYSLNYCCYHKKGISIKKANNKITDKISSGKLKPIIRTIIIGFDEMRDQDERQNILTYLTGLINRVESRSIVNWDAVTCDIEKHLTLPLEARVMEE